MVTSVADFLHTHTFDQQDPRAERRTRLVVWLTATMMVVEIVGGWLLNSMALLADGWHMSSHALALGLSLLAYSVARRYAADHRFNFGTWKVEVLGGYTSAVLLLGVAALMLFQSVERMASPRPIQYDEAIVIAIIGLVVNAVSAGLLQVGGHHAHHHNGHDHEHGHAPHHDLNLRSAYLHVLADAATSVFAIVALIGGKYWGADWLDPTMGIVGAVLVSVWAVGRLR
ncbi:CDF family Co(II)/Ni(II) efflux transporter DmeF, partial [Steroidobacter sp.]|uniref:CDF family Co(II)/Ni(II) efflux transporter DmeF n=1 Tax=Steroidobacter sp. TaxID=1978227 RepID=UPI001A3D3940|nr:CDF family Co(II)/Ni(II) efflux transporter DmeF [Steroidobacter sp.]